MVVGPLRQIRRDDSADPCYNSAELLISLRIPQYFLSFSDATSIPYNYSSFLRGVRPSAKPLYKSHGHFSKLNFSWLNA